MLAKQIGQDFALVVCESRAGFYLGTRDQQGAPFSRESVEYWPRRDAAEAALRTGCWTQRAEP